MLFGAYALNVLKTFGCAPQYSESVFSECCPVQRIHTNIIYLILITIGVARVRSQARAECVRAHASCTPADQLMMGRAHASRIALESVRMDDELIVLSVRRQLGGKWCSVKWSVGQLAQSAVRACEFGFDFGSRLRCVFCSLAFGGRMFELDRKKQDRHFMDQLLSKLEVLK